MTTTERIDVPGARGTVEIENPHGIFYKIRLNGEVIKRGKGGWSIPMRNGSTGKLASNGIIPGFQSLYFNDEKIYKMGAAVGTAERVAMFTPLILVIWVPLGALLAVILFFMGVSTVKNLQMPRGLRIALPIVNTLAGALILTLLTGSPGL